MKYYNNVAEAMEKAKENLRRQFKKEKILDENNKNSSEDLKDIDIATANVVNEEEK